MPSVQGVAGGIDVVTGVQGACRDIPGAGDISRGAPCRDIPGEISCGARRDIPGNYGNGYYWGAYGAGAATGTAVGAEAASSDKSSTTYNYYYSYTCWDAHNQRYYASTVPCSE